MADSVRLRILKDAIARLNASPAKPSGLSAELGPSRAAKIPGAAVYLPEDATRRAGTRRSRLDLHEVTVEVELRAGGDSLVSCYEAVDALWQWVDAALNGSVLDGALEEAAIIRTAMDVKGEDRPYVLAVVDVSVPSSQRVGDATLMK